MYEYISYSRYVLTVCMRGLCVRKGNKKRDSPPQTPQKGQTYPRVLSCFLNCTVRLRHLKLLTLLVCFILIYVVVLGQVLINSLGGIF